MKKASTLLPTTEELYALEKRAREERARVLAAGFHSAVTASKTLFARLFVTRAEKLHGKVRHA